MIQPPPPSTDPPAVPRAPLAAGRYRHIVALALPIVGGMISQNVLNLVDTWMVGKTGTASLAAVSSGGMVNFVAMAGVMGLSAGVQAVAARRHGQGEYQQTAAPLNGAMLLAVAVGIPLMVVTLALAPWIFRTLNPSPAVSAVGVPYLSARLVALPAAGLNFAFRGYWNGTGRSRLYLITLLIVHASNIVLNWLLIFGHLGFEARGAPGAGIASAIATYVGLGCYVLLGFRHARGNGFLETWPTRRGLQLIIRLAVPTCVQQLLFAGGLTVLFWILGRLGTVETAAGGVLVNVMLVAILPGLALGITSTSLVGHALGRGDPADAHRWGWQTAHVAIVFAVLIGLPMWWMPDWFLRPFLHDDAAIALARLPLQIFAGAITLDSVGTVLQQSLLGAGANRAVMFVSVFCQWGLFLPLAYLLGPVMGYGIVAVWAAQSGYRALQAGIYASMWQDRRWTKIRL
jgi:multidrug resistance protein, MATE family